MDEYDDPGSTIKPAWYRLKDNPERFTGYIGDSAARVWKLIYDENCFLPAVPAKNTMEYALSPSHSSLLHGGGDRHVCVSAAGCSSTTM